MFRNELLGFTILVVNGMFWV